VYQSRGKGNVWNNDEKAFLSSINGESVFSSPLRLVRRDTPKIGPLWIGPRIFKSAKSKPKPPFGDFPLRIATWPMKDAKMKRIEDCVSLRV
jgi:hypothetical protein